MTSYADVLEATYKTYRRLHKPTAVLAGKLKAARTAELYAEVRAGKRVVKNLGKRLTALKG